MTSVSSEYADQCFFQCSVHGLATMTVNINLDVRGESTEICSIALLIISVTVRGTREDRERDNYPDTSGPSLCVILIVGHTEFNTPNCAIDFN
ncbi:hypothetical protein RRG08_066552 [Elysia crispata]|uniref:Uncharacterized protein n=1 Tax=Elysia crispata TaxID=231223 RepID=A0AAE1CYL3_9GAST|nr:hypothetical protein RRG08_066552 [Elysia crispata]